MTPICRTIGGPAGCGGGKPPERPPFVTCLMLVNWPKRRPMIMDAIAGFHAQTWPHRELLVVNEGQPLRSTVDGVHVINTGPRKTLGQQRNLGLVEAAGDLIAPWDDDDVSLPPRLAVEINALQLTGAVSVRMRNLWLSDEKLQIACLVQSAGHATALFRADIARAVGGYGDTDYGEDSILHARIGQAGGVDVPLAARLYVYRRHGMNISAMAKESYGSWSKSCPLGVDLRAERAWVTSEVHRMRSEGPQDVLVPV